MSSRGDQLSQEAETLLKKKPFFGKDKHNIHVADKFKQAGNAYKTDRVWKRAGECHDHSGQIYSQNKEEKSGIDEYIEAAKCYEKDPECYKQAVSSYKNAASLLSKNEARAFEAGNCLADAGQVLLKANKIDDGLNLLEDAAKTLKNAKESNANVAKIYEQIADMLSDKGQYMKAVDFYQNVIQIRLGNSLTQGSAGIVFFKAALTYLQLNDIPGMKKKLDDFLKQNPAYRNDFHYKFLVELVEKIDQRDGAGFEEAVTRFGRQSTVDHWTQSRLDGLRQFVQTDEGNDDEDVGIL